MITENTLIKNCPIHLLTPNSLAVIKSSSELELSILKSLINEEGILEPLVITESGIIISGNRRFRAAIELGIKEVPVISLQAENDEIEKLVLHYNQRREKTEVEMYLEWERIKEIYGIQRGFRIDKNPAIKELKENTIGHLSKSQYESYQRLFKLIDELGKDRNDFIQKLIDGQTVSALSKKLQVEKSKIRIALKKENFELISEKLTLFNKSSFSAEGLDNESIDCIVSSPPYFQLRNYGNSNDTSLELGQERKVREFIFNLSNHFHSIMPKLKKDGKLWVNLMDSVCDGEYLNIVEQFICVMRDLGFRVIDKWIWIKNNPTPTMTSGANINHEHLICFGLAPNLSFNPINVEGISDEQKSLLTFNNGSKMKTAFLAPEKVFISNTNDFRDLKSKCEERGIPFTHTAGFPVELPELLIKLSTEPGDLVVDLFSGTGTTGQAALSLKRRYVGYELNPAFHEIAKVRLEDFKEHFVLNSYEKNDEELVDYALVA